MIRYQTWLIFMIIALSPLTGHAGLFSKKASKPDPKDRVPELLTIVKKDKDEHKRSAAANELRQYDPAAFPEIVPGLIDVLMNDSKPSVRADAAESLSKIRPVSKQAGLALEQALDKDPSTRVRMQARYSLLQYHWAGYKGGAKEAAVVDSKEPPLAPADNPKPIASSSSRKQQKVLKPTSESPAPPLAPPDTEPTIKVEKQKARELPVIPVKAPSRKPAPVEKSSDGPRLDPDD
jgi:hypothetical protein